jgi:siroheme synthase-like protein
MPTIPIALKIDDARTCLIVGGGRVALRKALWLLARGARIHVVSPEIDRDLEALARREPEKVTLSWEAYSSHDLAGEPARCQLVIAATNLEEVNRRVAEDARRQGVLVNVVDRPELCTFFVPAVVQREDLQIAVSTSGAAPGLAGRIRGDLEYQYPAWYGIYTAALGIVRREVIDRQLNPSRQHGLLSRLASRDVAEGLKELDFGRCVERLRSLAESWLNTTGSEGP